MAESETVTIKYWSCLGLIRIEANYNGIYRIDLLGNVEDSREGGEPAAVEQIEALNCEPDIKTNMKKCVNWLDKYFEGGFDSLRRKEVFPTLDRSHEG